MICKCKPTYNFQSIEFEWDLTEDNFPEMMEMYDRIVNGLMDIAPEQPDTKKPAAKKKEKKQPKQALATENQKKLMDKLGIQYDDTSTYDYAYNTIQFYIKSKDTHPGMHPVRVTQYDGEFNAFCAEIDSEIPANEYECDEDNWDYIFIDEDMYKSLVRRLKKLKKSDDK